MKLLRLNLIVVLALLGQPQAQKPASTFGPQVEEDYYPLPTELKLQVRDFQYRADQDEIKIQKLLVQIEQLKQDEMQALDSISIVATDFAKLKQVDPERFELDGNGVRLVKKKPQLIQAQPTNIPAQEKKP